jgi:hypothetical protein
MYFFYLAYDKNVFYPHIYLRYPGQKMWFTYANPRQKGISCGHYRCKNIFYLDKLTRLIDHGTKLRLNLLFFLVKENLILCLF